MFKLRVKPQGNPFIPSGEVGQLPNIERIYIDN